MSRGILGDRLFLHFSNVENNGDGLTKREEKRTAKDKISIDYICIKINIKIMLKVNFQGLIHCLPITIKQ